MNTDTDKIATPITTPTSSPKRNIAPVTTQAKAPSKGILLFHVLYMYTYIFRYIYTYLYIYIHVNFKASSNGMSLHAYC
jgi:hypothetical protein